MSRLHPTIGKAYGVLAEIITSPSSLVAGAGALKYAGRLHAAERAAFYRAEVAAATNPKAKQIARALAEDFEAEAAGTPLAALPEIPAFQTSSLPRRVARAVADVLQLPKAKAGFDLSAPARQGLPQVAAHPTYLRRAYVEQVKAFKSEEAFNSFVESIRARPDF